MNTRKKSGPKKIMLVVVALLVAFIAGYILRGPRHRLTPNTQHLTPASSSQAEVWTCSMHPQIRQPGPGKCPICAMDLIPAVTGGEEKTGPSELVMSEAARKLAAIRLAPVERRFVEVAVRMVGKVHMDETRIAYIAPRVPGRIDRLYVNFVGVPVKKGDHLADFYSPELVSAQQELIQAARAAGSRQTGAAPAGSDSTRAILESAREKLRLWQLTPEQIAEIERSGRPSDHITFYSPLAGVVVERMDTFEGMYVETGMKLFTVADLSRVWIKLDAYESDLVWLRYGQPVEFQVEAYPGETFQGTIAFIDPVLDPMTRTVKVRVDAANRDGRLKPEMFVRAVVRVTAADGGKVLQPDLAGKWISPMHPEVVKDGPGSCDVCGMPLVPAEELGYASAEVSAANAPLVIPASAPLVTGERAVVYVAVPGKEGAFEGREIVLGPRAGEAYMVRDGLKEGDLVVANGAFKIDSSLQIQGKASMMQPGEEVEGGRWEVGGKMEEGANAQTHCPVMGGAINREHYADYKGQRVYFCCPGCREPFLREPEKYLDKLRAEGVEPERSP
ncbi:MAG: HlyD family efflux transporter periplasmic adaptor subunit [Lentisphaerae bacterium]|nr:HlyD family efflux transporter periplasmic adaptor subunit [Lentisphaerota bacterium]